MKTMFRWILAFSLLFLLPAGEPRAAAPKKEHKLYYYLAIHVDPVDNIAKAALSFSILKKLVKTAETAGMRLTLMFSAQMAQYVASDVKALALVNLWDKKGHEIAFHHHDVYHGSGWDGYTDLSPDEVATALAAQGLSPADFKFNGDMDDYITAVDSLGFPITAGCMNDETEKRALPDEIVIDTCSGYINYGAPGTAGDDGDAMKGYNRYILTGDANGVTRMWLSHQSIDSDVNQAKNDFDSLSGGVFGVVTHSHKEDHVLALKDFVDFVSLKDPDASENVTLSEIVKKGLLPEEALP